MKTFLTLLVLALAVTLLYRQLSTLLPTRNLPALLNPLNHQVIKTPFFNLTITLPTPTPDFPQSQRFPRPLPTPVPTDTTPWGKAQQIGSDTYTMKIQLDPVMATPQEIFTALNHYRQTKGSQTLTWDNNLASFAQSRADYLDGIHSTDNHQGFIDFLNNQNGYDKLGFTWLGENISNGYRLAGVHLIEWIFAGDQPHDDNQLNNRWNYVGVGVKGTAVSIIFGTGKS